MRKVVILLLAVLFVFAGCDGGIDGGFNPNEPIDPDDIIIETISTGQKFRGDLSSIGVDENGLITFADYPEFYDFRDKYFTDEENGKLILSTMWCRQDMKPEYQAEYDHAYNSLNEGYSNSRNELDNDYVNGLITVNEYYAQLEVLEDEYQSKFEILQRSWQSRTGVWGDVRVQIVGKNRSSEPVALYMIDSDYRSYVQFFGPVEFSVSDEWQGYIYRFDNGGDLYPRGDFPYYMEI